MVKRIVPFLMLALCFSTVHAGYADGLISAGEYESGVEWFSSTLIVNGGGADEIFVRYAARLEVRSTSSPLGLDVGGIMDIALTNTSRMDYYGGLTQELSLFKNATTYLYGGRIDYISSHQLVQWLNGEPFGQHIIIDCQLGWSWILNNQQKVGIAGMWRDGSAFNIRFLNDADYDPVWANVNVMPEPASMFLLGLGGLLLRRKK